jgi:ABC-type spermidine/putrescine transport system permease subunit II
MRNRRADRLGRWAVNAVVATVALALSLPLAIVVATAFTSSGSVTFPPPGLSTRWVGALLASPDWTRAILNSFLVASGTTVVSMAVGVTAALAVRRLRGGVRSAVAALAVVPLLVPGIVLGITLLTFFSRFGLQQTYLAIVLGHSLWATPLTFSVVRATFSRFDWRIHEAALDLGASPTRAFFEVVVPNTRAGLTVAALVGFVVSLQEFVIALFLSGPDTRTVPVEAWNSLREGLDPLVSVVSTVLLVAVVALIVVAGVAVGLDRFAADT